jgi:hypothetical protein
VGTRDEGRAIAAFNSYAEAERAVDYLADRGFPVEHVTIIGHDLRTVERVTGRVDYRDAALRGMSGGAVTGALIGWLFGLLDWVSPLIASVWLALDGLVFGAIVGAVFGVLTHWAQQGRRDFASVAVTLPQRYEVLVDSDYADRAAELLHEASPSMHIRKSNV